MQSLHNPTRYIHPWPPFLDPRVSFELSLNSLWSWGWLSWPTVFQVLGTGWCHHARCLFDLSQSQLPCWRNGLWLKEIAYHHSPQPLWTRVSLCSLDWPRTHDEDQNNLEFAVVVLLSTDITGILPHLDKDLAAAPFSEILIVYVCVSRRVCVCVHICIPGTCRSLWRLEEGIRCPRTRVTGGCEPPWALCNSNKYS